MLRILNFLCLLLNQLMCAMMRAKFLDKRGSLGKLEPSGIYWTPDKEPIPVDDVESAELMASTHKFFRGEIWSFS